MTPSIVLTVGIPYYYPGPFYDALAAIFGNERDEYVHEGSAWLRVGVALPLFKLKTAEVTPPRRTTDPPRPRPVPGREPTSPLRSSC